MASMFVVWKKRAVAHGFSPCGENVKLRFVAHGRSVPFFRYLLH